MKIDSIPFRQSRSTSLPTTVSLAVSFALLFTTQTLPIYALNGNPANNRIAGRNGWKSFEVVTQGDVFTNPDGSSYTMLGNIDGLGAYRVDGTSDLRLFLNHESPYSCESARASVSEVIVDRDLLRRAIENAILSPSSVGDTGGVEFIKSMGKAYNSYRNKDGNPGTINEGTFTYFCSGQVHEANTFGPNIGFVDRLYIFGEEIDNGKMFTIHEKTLYQITGAGVGDASLLQGGINGMGFDSLENVALISTGEEDHVVMMMSPDYGSTALRLYVGIKGFQTDGQSCGACAGDENLLARN